jgi:hypothetical protein
MHTGPKSDVTQDGPENPEEFFEVLHCVRKEVTRTYRLRAIAGGAELWRATESDLGGIHWIKESDFQSSEQVTAFLEELRRSLLAGGWLEE